MQFSFSLHRFLPGLAVGATILAAGVALELRSPAVFLQDDNRDGFLPLYVHNVRALERGDLAEYNPHQSLGLPHLANGQSATLHPSPYLAVWLSERLFGHSQGAIDLLVVVHLVVGGIGCAWLVSGQGAGSPAAMFAGSSWGLQPFLWYASRSWVNYALLAAVLPWCVGFLLRYLRLPNRRDACGYAAATLYLFYFGAVQWSFLVSLLCGALTGVVVLDRRWRRKESLRRSLRPLLAFAVLHIGVTALESPVLLPLAHQMTLSAERADALPYATFSDEALSPMTLASGLLTPWASWREPRPGRDFTELAAPPWMMHLGYLTLALVIAALMSLWREPESRRPVLTVPVAFSGLTLAWSLGGLSFILYFVPILNRFRWPFKLYPFAAFFLILVATVVFDRRLSASKSWARWVWVLLAFHAINLVGVNHLPSPAGFLTHLEPVPIEESRAEQFSQQRIASVGYPAGKGYVGYTAESLGFSYATLFGLYHLGGYDPLLPAANREATLGLNYTASLSPDPQALPLDYLRFWGVGWYVVNPMHARDVDEYLGENGLERAALDSHRAIYRDPAARPMVESVDGSCSVSSVDLSGSRFSFSSSCRSEGVVRLAFLYQTHFRARADSRELEIGAGQLGELLVSLPAGDRAVTIVYRDPLLRVGIAVALLTLGAAFLLSRRVRELMRIPQEDL